MTRNLVVLALALAAVCASPLPISTNEPIAFTTNGLYRGFEYTTKTNPPRNAHIYLGIDYVKPPVGELRFEKPQPPDFHYGIKNATKFGYICHPHIRGAITPGLTADEDCLFLNIIKPANAHIFSNLPVLVWIHGGGYEIGSSNLFGYTGFADNYVPQDIIVVTIQYRVGVYGYLSTGNGDLPGNFGSWDQVEAIKYIKKNIAFFGGNPNKITAWGLSAGGCAAAELILSTQSRDMIAGAIEMSGSAYSYWGTGTTVVGHSVHLTETLNCPTSGETMKKCLKQKSVDEIYNAVATIGYTNNELASLKWGPVIDGPGGFMEDSPYVLAKTAPKKPIIVGAGDKDTGYFATMGYSPFIHNLSIPINEQTAFSPDRLCAWLDYLIKDDWFGANRTLALHKMQSRYCPAGQSNGETVNQWVRFTDEFFFYKPTVEGILSRKAQGWEIYAYEFEQYNPLIYTIKGVNSQEAWGSVHTNEYAYMFDLFNLGAYTRTQDDQKVHDQLVAAIGSFTKTGKPHIPNKSWPKVGNDMKYYVFKGDGELRNNYFKSGYEFIKSLDDLGFDLGFLLPTNQVKRN